MLSFQCHAIDLCVCNAEFETPQQHGMPGRNVEAMLALTFMEAALGTQRTFRASVRMQCPECVGYGLSATSRSVDCTGCHGTGETLRLHTSSLGETT